MPASFVCKSICSKINVLPALGSFKTKPVILLVARCSYLSGQFRLFAPKFWAHLFCECRWSVGYAWRWTGTSTLHAVIKFIWTFFHSMVMGTQKPSLYYLCTLPSCGSCLAFMFFTPCLCTLPQPTDHSCQWWWGDPNLQGARVQRLRVQS